MPSYVIDEKDFTTSRILAQVPSIVYIPCVSTAAIKRKLFTSSFDLIEDEKISGDVNIKNDIGYKLAIKLLNLGMQVILEGFESSTKPNATTQKELSEKGTYDIKYLIAGSFADDDEVANTLIGVATARQDCIALIDHKKASNSLEAVKKDVAARGVGDDLSYVSYCTPWIKLSGIETECPASFGFLLAIARALQSNPSWFAAAGAFRGSIPGLLDVAYSYSESEVEELQNSTSHSAINPICEIRPYGTIVWGNRTGLIKPELKATSFLNVRSLVCELKKVLYTVSRKYTFEQNSDILWFNFKSDLTPILDKMQTGDGILGYTIERIKTNEKGKLKARIIIVPIEAVENFELIVNISDSIKVEE